MSLDKLKAAFGYYLGITNYEKIPVRTDVILQQVFSHLVSDFNFDGMNTMNEKEKLLIQKINEIMSLFRKSYADSIKSLCEKINDINEENTSFILLGVFSEVFSKGITWSKIIAFFVFVGELTTLCIERKLSKSIVDAIYQSFSTLVKEKLEVWIKDHNGWEGMTNWSVVLQKENESICWIKNLLSAGSKKIYKIILEWKLIKYNYLFIIYLKLKI